MKFQTGRISQVGLSLFHLICGMGCTQFASNSKLVFQRLGVIMQILSFDFSSLLLSYFDAESLRCYSLDITLYIFFAFLYREALTQISSHNGSAHFQSLISVSITSKSHRFPFDSSLISTLSKSRMVVSIRHWIELLRDDRTINVNGEQIDQETLLRQLLKSMDQQISKLRGLYLCLIEKRTRSSRNYWSWSSIRSTG